MNAKPMFLDGEGPLFLQVVRALREAIVSGAYRPGSRLPATRDLARDLGVSRATVLIAYEQLAAEGFVSGKRGSGTYVQGPIGSPVKKSALGQRSPGGVTRKGETSASHAAQPVRLSRVGQSLTGTRRLPIESAYVSDRPVLRWDFRYSMPTLDEFPLEAWQRYLGRTARRASRRVYDYGSPQGSPALRAALAEYLGRARGVRCAPEQILLVTGSQQAIDLVARVVLDPRDGVVVEEPGYEGIRRAAAAAQAELIPTPVDDEGIDPTGLGEARLAVVTPSHQFPLGGILSWRRRLALLGWADRHDAWILEDDYDGEFRFDGPPIPPLKALDRNDRVLYLGTFSKVMFPALRIGYLLCPEPLLDPLTRMKLVADGGSPRLEQEALADFIAQGGFARHVRRARARASERRKLLVRALQEALGERIEIVGANAGLHLVIWLRDAPGKLAGSIAKRLAEVGVGIYPITPYTVTPPRRAGFILGYGALALRDIRPAVARLAEALAEIHP